MADRFAAGQRLLTPATRALMRATGAQVDEAIDRALSELGTFCMADRTYVFRFADDGTTVNNTHEWCGPGVTPQIDLLQGLPRSIVRPWLPCLETDRVLVVQDVSEMPEGDDLREILESQDIRALIAVPLTDAGQLTGFVGFDIVNDRDPFDLVEVGLLRIVGDAIGAALARRDAAMAAERARDRARIAEDEVHRLARVTEVSTNLIVILDTAFRIVWVNRAFEEQTGYRLADIEGRQFHDLVRGPETDRDAEHAVRQASIGHESYEGEAVNYDARGQPYWIQFNQHPLHDPAGTLVGYVSIETVVTERKALEQDIEARNAFLSTVLRTSASGIVALNASGAVIYANEAAQTILGLTPDTTGGGGFLKPVGWRAETLDGTPMADTDLPSAICRRSMAEARDTRYALRLPDGSRRVLSVNAAPLDQALDGAEFVLSINDITEMEETAERLRDLADEDPLTGLANRRAFAAAIEAALDPGDASEGRFALVMLDLDNFKVVNDTLRHDAGDTVLRKAAERLIGAARDRDCVARVGGDEFLVLAPGLPADEAEAYAERLRSAVAQPVALGDQSFNLTASAGVSLFPRHGKDSSTLMTGADVALFAAKRSGRNRTMTLSPALYKAEARRSAILNALSGEMLERSLHLVFQPQFALDDQRSINGAEVLLRWTDPKLGAVGAAEFVPIAEEAGMINRIDACVTDLAVRQLAAWAGAGWAHPISVNVSSQTIARAGFASGLIDRLHAASVDPRLLTVELTETSPITLTPAARENVSLLRGAGVGLAIDDFGTGYASLSYLQRIAASELKIDREFVSRLDTTRRCYNGALIRAIIAVARALGLSITAEGVETEAQLDWLAQEGCHRVQGYLTGQPMSAAAFRAAYIDLDDQTGALPRPAFGAGMSGR